jgi:peptide/nickel transport system permease protein
MSQTAQALPVPTRRRKLPAAFRSSKGVIGATLVLTIFAIALLAPVFIPDDWATRMDMRARLSPPTLAHPLGTDQLGRDLMFRVLLGTQTSIYIATAAVFLSIVIGLPLGLISGYVGRTTDNVLMRLVDTLLSFPALLLALTISAVLGPNLQNTIIAIGIAFTPFLARIIRGETLRVAQMPYVEAARTAGNSDLRLIVHHILPNIMPAVIVQCTISLAFAILAEAGLSFLGLGTQPPDASWGLMIQASRDYLDRAPWTALVPGAAVAITVLGLNMFGDALRDALDPRSKGGA